MIGEKFTLMQYSISAILGLIEAEDFVIPEIQRPFVWKRSQVRDLIDSLYSGYPTGYIITWKNPDVQTKDGGKANGKKILIDGQQRITSLMAAISGKEVLDEDFNKDRIKIAFNPLATDETKRFAVQDASHIKNKKWIPDISVVFDSNFDPFDFALKYCEANEGIKPNDINKAITALKGIANRQIGVIELDHSLDIDEVTEIFIRINSKGTALSQSDFVMSKMAADIEHGGNILRKTVDYFCHLAVKPEFYSHITNDEEFQNSKYASKIKWLSKDYDDIFDPDYYLIDSVDGLVYRREQFEDDDDLAAEYIVADRRYTKLQIISLFQSIGFKIIDVRYVQAGHWDKSLEPTDKKAKELSLIHI